jgi:hypothetical protein
MVECCQRSQIGSSPGLLVDVQNPFRALSGYPSAGKTANSPVLQLFLLPDPDASARHIGKDEDPESLFTRRPRSRRWHRGRRGRLGGRNERRERRRLNRLLDRPDRNDFTAGRGLCRRPEHGNKNAADDLAHQGSTTVVLTC